MPSSTATSVDKNKTLQPLRGGILATGQRSPFSVHHARGVLRLAAAARDRAGQGDSGGGGVRAAAAASDAGDAAAADAPDGRTLPTAAPGEGRGGGGTGSQRLTFWIK